ncbi:MAG: hypothetical protein GX318_07615 [Clostridia bacterium]|nr:hypothetical protein [Clostridia bacterium]
MSRCRSCGGCRGFTAGRDHDAEGSDILNTIVFALPFIVILLTSYIIKNPTPKGLLIGAALILIPLIIFLVLYYGFGWGRKDEEIDGIQCQLEAENVE